MSDFNWVKEYNDLFETINHQGEDSYFSGPRFISVIREFDSSFPDYMQYLDYRKSKSLSTSRKNYFFDILSVFPDDVRKKIITRIYDIALGKNKSFSKREMASPIGNLEENVSEPMKKKENKILKKEAKEANIEENNEELASTEVIENPRVFISYSWDNEDHKNWILNLAKRLRDNGIEVILDRYELQGGKNINHFMERALEESDKVLVIFTPNYKLKADKREGGVGYEYSILNNEIYQNIANNDKYIPVIKSGDFNTSIPNFMKQFIAVDFRNSEHYEDKIRELTLTIYGKPLIEKPKLGEKPDYIK